MNTHEIKGISRKRIKNFTKKNQKFQLKVTEFMDFSNINSENKGTAALLSALKKTSFVKADYSNDDEWKIQKDKEGNGAAVIRFIPSKDGELFQEVRSHGYKNQSSNRWYIENCPKTLDWDETCPACEHANALMGGRDYKTLEENEKKKIKPFFAATSYWACVLVEKDAANPENEGKVFKYRFGKKILEKILERAGDDPLDDSIKGINIFDVLDGASFKLMVKKVAGFPNYDTSSFKAPEPILKGSMKAIDKLVASGHDIAYMSTKKNFKDYSELKKKFYSIIDQAEPATKSADDIPDDAETEKFDDTTESAENAMDDTGGGDDGDGDLDYFANLSKENI